MARGLDHLVLATRDLDAAADHYRSMGFTVGARNRHPWGTENRIVQMPGTFLELITLGEGIELPAPEPETMSFARTIARQFDAHGDGFPMLVVESLDAAADKEAFDAAGIGGFRPFFFERIAVKPDGTKARVAFTLAFAADPAMPEAGFFACQQHEPQNFWNPAFQRHPNGATGVAGVVLLAETPAALVPFFEAFTASRAACAGARNMAIVTPRGTIEAMTPDCYRDVLGLEPSLSPAGGPRLAAFKVSAPLEAMAQRLEEAGIPFLRHRRHLAVAAPDNFGTAILFEEPKAGAPRA
ncbi:VOC family protein [Labrys monachus]|uniref:Catechol 2,3-dioxygenase-like lactoylglutathione lyase family enzyme n=1 Tax=Labrys monachus TaxID=217067 RepID=A0ABU0FGY7_9HYPH|nr:VOC family protein [Labrys monachus]MDQ0393862.1 catechol 2,3-dioxygenase-like lactoylglutathione lyase family enzyme [Labrys monachus]